MNSAASAPDPTLVASVVPLSPAWGLDRTFDYVVPDKLLARTAIGSLVRVPLGTRKVRGVVLGLEQRADTTELVELAAVVVDEPVAPPPVDSLARWVAHRYAVPTGKALERFVPPRVRPHKAEPQPLGPGPEPALVPTYGRGTELLRAIVERNGGVWSLVSLPSHDRGRLIAELVGAASAARGSALVAVPEVRFGSIVLDALETWWPGTARVDSSRPDAQRAEAWSMMARGHGLGAGGRASVFAPAPDLRLIVVNDEHHRTFKEDRSPRYHARRVAIERARLQGAVCVLVSDSPSLEAYTAATTDRRVEPSLEQRRAARPAIEIVERSDRVDISEAVYRRMQTALTEGVPIAILAPRRGYARVVWCAACRRSLACPRCETPMTLHEVGDPRVRCPRCELTLPPPPVCPNCSANDFRFIGAGNERLAEQLGRSFPRAQVRRMDPTTLESGVELGPSDIYVTTWIGTKPEIRPPARLVIVLDADSLIRRPDLSAAEEAHHSLSEMARWAGPASEGGRLVIQTSEPGHHAVQAIARGNPAYFLEREMEVRRELGYPPYSELVRVTLLGKKQAEVAAEVVRIARAANATPLGPIPSRRVEDQEALEVLVKCADATALATALRPLFTAFPAGSLRVDTDPR